MPSMHSQLLARIQDKSAVVAVVGLGYVGLPLALEFARAGYRVIGFDVSQRVVDGLMGGRSHIQDVKDAELAAEVAAGRFEATTDESRLREADAISIAVPTPLSKTRDPDMSYVEKAVEAVARNCHPGLLIVLESTTYPGTTREIMLPKLDRKSVV